MNRALWKSKSGKTVGEKHCGNCAYSIRYLKDKGRIDQACPCVAIQENLGVGKVKITSTCSGQSFIYPKFVVIDGEYMELFN